MKDKRTELIDKFSEILVNTTAFTRAKIELSKFAQSLESINDLEAHDERSEANEGESETCDCTYSQACEICGDSKGINKGLWGYIKASND